MSETTHIYVARAACGCVTAVLIDDPTDKKWVAREVASLIRGGCSVTRVTRDVYRKLDLNHTCGKER